MAMIGQFEVTLFGGPLDGERIGLSPRLAEAGMTIEFGWEHGRDVAPWGQPAPRSVRYMIVKVQVSAGDRGPDFTAKAQHVPGGKE